MHKQERYEAAIGGADRWKAYPTDFKKLARVCTGASMLDSGSAYGRQWERAAIPPSFPLEYARSYSDNCADVLINTAQALDDIAAIDQSATRHFRSWAHRADPNDDRYWGELSERYIERMVATGRWERIDGDAPPYVDNPYNRDTELDQVFVVVAHSPYSRYALLQMHTGCDVRGGYTPPVVADFGTYGDGIAGLHDRVDFYCYRCGLASEDPYCAERDGWRPRVNKRSVAFLCPKCKRVAFKLPIPEENERAD